MTKKVHCGQLMKRTMHSNIVIVVSRTHWRCIPCKLYSKRLESIDQHLLLQHSVFEKPQLNSGVKSEKYSCSDGELEMDYGHYQYKLSFNLLPFKKVEDKRLRNNKILPSISPKKCSDVDFRTQKRSCRKQPKKTIKRQTRGFIAEDGCTDFDSPAYQTDENKSNDTKEELPYRKKPSGINIRKKTAKTFKKQFATVDSPAIQMLEESLPKKRPPSLSMLSNQGSPLGEENDLIKSDLLAAARSCRTVHAKNGKDRKPDTSGERNNMKKDRRSKIGACRKSNKVASYTKKSKNGVDKSKIATCCAPWLFDAGRKAGEKVKKKQRRPMLPEEKDAVRELYGIPSHEPMPTHLPYHGFADGQCFSMKGQHATTSISVPTIQSSTTSIKTSQGGDPAACINERNTNMFSSSTHDFLRSQNSLYADYSDVNIQDQTHRLAAEASGTRSSADAVQNTDSVGYPCMDRTPNGQFYTQTDTIMQPVNSIYSGQHSGMSSLPQHVMPFSHNEPQSSVSQNSIFKSSSFFEEHNLATSLLTPASTETGQGNMATKDEEVNVCSICLQKFVSASEVHKHLQEMARFPVAVCKLCRAKFHGIHELNLHIFSEHEPGKQVFCFTCNEDATGLEGLERHMAKHTFSGDCKLVNTKFHDCRICREELQSSYRVVRIHYYQQHVSHVCCHCFSNFQDLMSYQEHCKKHDGKPITCSICGKEFDGFEELRSHFPCSEDVWAEDGKGGQCSKCGLWCPNRAVVEAHRKQHRSEDDVEAYRKGAQQGFPCVSCEKVFKNKHACRRHIKMVHEGVKCYKHYCEYCGKGFLTKNHMHDHIALHHLGIKRYRCEYCDQHFVCAPTLRRHVRKEHTKHKPYTCEHCGERFFEKTPLQRHLTVHTGLAPFMCEHCGKGFYTKHSFTNHGTTHSTTRDFICSGCRKGFTRKYNLQAHMKTCKLV